MSDESAMERNKRWAKGLLVLVYAWLGSDEVPLGQYDAKPVEPDETEDGEPGFGPVLVTRGVIHMFKKITVGGVAAAAIAAAGIAAAGPAGATIAVIGSEGDHNPYHYRDELRYTGLYHEDVANAYSLASRVCGKRSIGYTEEQLIRGLEYSADQYTSEQAVMIVSGAEYHFCPAYEDDGSVGRGYIGPPETV